jgi:hypothetical protein
LSTKGEFLLRPVRILATISILALTTTPPFWSHSRLIRPGRRTTSQMVLSSPVVPPSHLLVHLGPPPFELSHLLGTVHATPAFMSDCYWLSYRHLYLPMSSTSSQPSSTPSTPSTRGAPIHPPYTLLQPKQPLRSNPPLHPRLLALTLPHYRPPLPLTSLHHHLDASTLRLPEQHIRLSVSQNFYLFDDTPQTLVRIQDTSHLLTPTAPRRTWT